MGICFNKNLRSKKKNETLKAPPNLFDTSLKSYRESIKVKNEEISTKIVTDLSDNYHNINKEKIFLEIRLQSCDIKYIILNEIANKVIYQARISDYLEFVEFISLSKDCFTKLSIKNDNPNVNTIIMDFAEIHSELKLKGKKLKNKIHDFSTKLEGIFQSLKNS